MKVKFLENYDGYNRGMQYPIMQIGLEKAEQLEKEGIAKIFPQIDLEPEKGAIAEAPKAIKTVKNPKKKG